VLANPYSHGSMDRAIAEALVMPKPEQCERMVTMNQAVEEFTVEHWAEQQLGELSVL